MYGKCIYIFLYIQKTGRRKKRGVQKRAPGDGLHGTPPENRGAGRASCRSTPPTHEHTGMASPIKRTSLQCKKVPRRHPRWFGVAHVRRARTDPKPGNHKNNCRLNRRVLELFWIITFKVITEDIILANKAWWA